MDHDDVTPDNLPGTGKPWEPDYSHTDPDIDMKGPHFHAWLLKHEPETLMPFYVPMLRGLPEPRQCELSHQEICGARTRPRRLHGA